MSGYEVDRPQGDEDHEEYDQYEPTEQDRELLDADEADPEVSTDSLADPTDRSSQSARPARPSRKQSSGTKSTKHFGRKVKFDYAPLGDENGRENRDGRDSRDGRGGASPQSKSSRLQRMSYADDNDEYYSDDSEIEIDLEARPGRRRAQNRAFRRKMHLLLGVASLLAFFLFLSNLFGDNHGENTDKNAKGGSGGNGSKLPANKLLLSNGTHDFHPTTLVLSLDGFHPHYINHELTPNLHSLYTQHSSMPYLIPSFPSTTFANHWTLVTGLYPENHGIVSNNFYDPAIQRQFVSTDKESSLASEWWGGEPIWQTATAQGVRAAVHMWVGSEVDWPQAEGRGAFLEVDEFNATEVLPNKVNRVMHWLDRDISSRPQLILAYTPSVDVVGHAVGIAGKPLRDSIAAADRMVGSMLDGLRARNLDSIVNVVVVSDHGMAPTSNSRLIYFDDLVDMDAIKYVDGWPLVGLRPKQGQSVGDLYSDLKAKEHDRANGTWAVYKREDMPKEWHYGSGSGGKYHDRIAPLWLVPTVGWVFTTHDKMAKMDGEYKPFGVHGYNISEPLMRATFAATGPYFKKSLKYEPVPNVDVYNILCDTLSLKPARGDGRPVSRSLQVLPANWRDPVEYPGVDFHTEILKINSTYDDLYRGGHHGQGSQDQGDEASETWADWFKSMLDRAKNWAKNHKGKGDD